MHERINLEVSQLTEYQRKLLNKNRICVYCGERIHDYDLVSYASRRDGRFVQHAFYHAGCGYGAEENPFLAKGLTYGISHI